MDTEVQEKYVIKECFAINLKWYRFNKNYTQEYLAELCELSPKYISDLERGKFCPSFAKMEKIARVLKVEPYMLIKPDHLSDISDLPDKIDKKIGRKRNRNEKTKQ